MHAAHQCAPSDGWGLQPQPCHEDPVARTHAVDRSQATLHARRAGVRPQPHAASCVHMCTLCHGARPHAAMVCHAYAYASPHTRSRTCSQRARAHAHAHAHAYAPGAHTHAHTHAHMLMHMHPARTRTRTRTHTRSCICTRRAHLENGARRLLTLRYRRWRRLLGRCLLRPRSGG